MEPDLLPPLLIPAPGTRRAAKARRGGQLEQQRQEEAEDSSSIGKKRQRRAARGDHGATRGSALPHLRPSRWYSDPLALPFVLVLCPSSRVL